ncbi:phosphoribosyltransferase [Nitratireductor sp. ZSWI3]|uniref:phosphoribosyltransferase n=1 Tax=Nitratireductor sp. ZSWI3 TaxID=2966359 RepID=UPI002150262D|nr:phosphoribosyltransferase [Nitratireductor sp. ZSWI3]MCR4265763.1 phosphoribosyltransferase [Nitratireductor sp. ZSWI3]
MSSSLYEGFAALTREYVPENPNFAFLDETLLRKSSHRERNGTVFFSCRSWRRDLKKLQISSIRNLKRWPDERPVELISDQIAALAKKITNGEPYRFVVPVPAGSSQRDVNFASIIAPFVAQKLGSTCRNLLQGRISGPHSASSHPRQSFRFEVSCPLNEKGEGLVLLVDDVATTGAHFGRSVACLRRLGYSAVCISWVS